MDWLRGREKKESALTSMKVGRLESVGRSVIRKFMFLYVISDGPGRIRGETMAPPAFSLILPLLMIR